MTITLVQNRGREAAYLTAMTAAFVYSGHLTGKARLGSLSDEEARRLLTEAEKAKALLIG